MVDFEETTIKLTRGDAPTGELNRLAFYLPVKNLDTGEIENYEFQLTDKISFVVYPKKGYNQNEIFRIDYTLADLGYTEPDTVVEIPLTEELTSLFPIKNKRETYWYVLKLNDTLTILGFDDEGAEKLIVYPDGGK